MSDSATAQPVCDCHMHSFAKSAPVQAGGYAPPQRDLTDYLPEARPNNIERAVVVQASVDGTDNSRLVSTLKSASGIAVRGVAMIAADTDGLAEMHAAGVRAVRIQDRSRLGRHDLDLLPQLARRAADMHWHVELNTEPERYHVVADMIDALPQGLNLVLDHIGHVDPNQPSQLDALCRLLATGRVWVKLALTRVSQRADYRDLTGIISRIAGENPERCVWGSDWPHVMTEPPLPEIAPMLDLLRNALTTGQFRNAVWSNPEKLYDF